MNRPDIMTNFLPSTFEIAGAQLVLEDRVARGGMVIDNGRIVEIKEGDRVSASAIDFGGDYLMAGIVDIHTDHFEKHILPRPHVKWDALSAAIAHDTQIIGSGITTVFDSLCVGITDGAAQREIDRRSILAPMIDALETAADNGMLRADHLIHLRCEIVDEETPSLLQHNIHRPLVRIASVMDHTPGQRQTQDIEWLIDRMMVASSLSRDAAEASVRKTMQRSQDLADRVRRNVVAQVNAAGLPLLSHDDATIAHIDEARDDGVAIAEFPTTIEAAREAKKIGLLTVAGAPNYLRGGSQSGNVAVRELLLEGLVDILASDYVPRSILDAVFAIADDMELGLDLPHAVRLATLNPAGATGLADRGRLAAGLRADLLRVRLTAGRPVLGAVWSEGRRVA